MCQLSIGLKSLLSASTNQSSHTGFSTNHGAPDLAYARFPALASNSLFINPLSNQEYKQTDTRTSKMLHQTEK